MLAPKIEVKKARQDVEGSDALLVCAYDDKGKFEENRLEGAIPLDELREREDSLSKQRVLVFYCA